MQLKLRGLANLKYFTDPISVKMLGQRDAFASPIGVGSFAHQGIAHKDGELASAAAAAEMNQLYVLSAASTHSIEDVVKATRGKGRMMLEIDMRLPKMIVSDLIVRISKHDCFIGVVLNAHYHSDRVTENEWKNDFLIPAHLSAGTLVKYAWQVPSSLTENAEALGSCYGLLKNADATNRKETFGLGDISFIKSMFEGRTADVKIVVKGIMTADDAVDVIKAGADAIWISNGGHVKACHAPSTLTVLKNIVRVVKSNSSTSHAEILVDSGIRRGTDVMKLIALGADTILVSRPIMYGLVYGGQDGVKNLLTMLNEELKLAMALTHCFNVSEVTEEQVVHVIRPKL